MFQIKWPVSGHSVQFYAMPETLMLHVTHTENDPPSNKNLLSGLGADGQGEFQGNM